MAPYLSPGVYVEEVPPLARPIAGVGTSTAGFIGVIPDTIVVPTGTKKVPNANAGKGKKDTTDYPLPAGTYPVALTPGSFQVRVDGQVVANASLKNDDQQKASSVSFTEAPAQGTQINVDFVSFVAQNFKPVEAGKVQLCTTFADFTKSFGDFSQDEGQQFLAHAVFGFFNNGGTRCYVVRRSEQMALPRPCSGSKPLMRLRLSPHRAWQLCEMLWQITARRWRIDLPFWKAKRKISLTISRPVRLETILTRPSTFLGSGYTTR